jgi:hypothetical protein
MTGLCLMLEVSCYCRESIPVAQARRFSTCCHITSVFEKVTLNNGRERRTEGVAGKRKENEEDDRPASFGF